MARATIHISTCLGKFRAFERYLEPLNDWNPIRRFIVALTLSLPHSSLKVSECQPPSYLQGLVIACCTTEDEVFNETLEINLKPLNLDVDISTSI